jgi:hypothetical protein
VTALKLLAPGREQGALARLAELTTAQGWPTTLEIEPGSVAPVTDLIQGSAGIVLAAVWAGGAAAHGITAAGGQALLQAADQAEDGLDWAMLPGWPSRTPHYSHGTAGVATALAIAGAALGRPDFVAAGRRGAEHLLAVGSLDENGFIIPHTLPYSTRDVDPVTYNWCHGPAGTSQLFAALAAAAMADALAERALRDRAGAYWRFTEHRRDPPLLPPGTSWMQGAAGIAAFLLRMARVAEHGRSAPVVDRPDQWWAVPAQLRTVHTGAMPHR